MNNKQEPGILFGLLFQGFWIAFQMMFVCVGRQLQEQELYWIGIVFVGIGILVFILLVIKPIISFIITLIAAQVLIAAQKNKNQYSDCNNEYQIDKVSMNGQSMNGQSMNSNKTYGNYGDGSKYR